ncbi:hypothetical protein, partial [Bosea sp. (in: a-proteobacteria)]|uniref:hypothetical protein n=1 Tax=Bosea sp. (in: a-proteobacteria) TaxID=1871050 RepID=UPI0031FF426F
MSAAVVVACVTGLLLLPPVHPQGVYANFVNEAPCESRRARLSGSGRSGPASRIADAEDRVPNEKRYCGATRVILRCRAAFVS